MIPPRALCLSIIGLTFLLSEPAEGLAQPVLPTDSPGTILELSVEDVAVLVLQNNRDLKVRRLNPVIAGTFEQIERGVFDAEFFAEAEYGEEQASETSRSTSSQFDVKAKDQLAAAGIRKFFPTGTTVEGSVKQTRSYSDRSPEQQVARAGLTLTQALLQGFGPAVNLAAVRQSEFGTVASRYELQAFTEALLAAAETEYWNYVLAKEEIAIFESSLAVARRQLDETELRIEVGILPEVEAAAARAEVARREQALIDARSLLEEHRLRLLRMVSPDSENPFGYRIRSGSDPRIDTPPLADLAERLQLAEKKRPDLNEARTRLEQYRLETVVTRNGLLPRLDFFITLGKTGYSDTFSGSFRELDGDTYDLLVGLRLSKILGDREARGRDLAARTTLQQGKEAIANLKQLVQLDVLLAANDLERTRKQISAAAATRDLQEKTLAAERDRFDVGASTSLLVSQAQRDLLISQITEIQAIVNYRKALVNLYLAEGTLLERRGIRLGE